MVSVGTAVAVTVFVDDGNGVTVGSRVADGISVNVAAISVKSGVNDDTGAKVFTGTGVGLGRLA